MSSNSGNSHEASHFVVTAHPPGSVLLTTKCNFVAPQSTDIVIAKSARLEVRQFQGDSDNNGGDTLPVFLQLPINGRLVGLHALTIKSLPTAVLFLLLDRYQYAAISYAPQQPSNTKDAGQLPKVTAYPVYTHACGSLETGSISRPNESGTIIAVDPYNRCIAIHAFDGLITILPVDPHYTPPSNAKSHDGSEKVNLRRPKQLLGKPFHCRVEETTILSIAFLYTGSSHDLSPPIQLAVLYQDSRGAQHLTTHVINLQKQQIHLYGSQSAPKSIQWLKKLAVDGGSSMLIPVQVSLQQEQSAAATLSNNVQHTESTPVSPAVVVVGQRQLTFCSTTRAKIVPVSQALFLAYTELPCDPNSGMPRYLLADDLGNLHMLSFMAVKDRVVAMQLDTLGSCTLASSLTYVHEGLLFVGSSFGDSQLIQIHDDPIVPASTVREDEGKADYHAGSDAMFESSYLSVVDEYTNLGPILDFDLIPTTPHHGSPAPNSGGGLPYPQMVQSQVVTASGASKSGSIRIVRNGIGMNEYASVEIPGIQAMWSLRASYDAQEDAYLVQSFVGETRVLGVISAASTDDMKRDAEDEDQKETVGGTLAEVILPGLDSEASTLYVGNIQANDRVIQVTGTEVRLLAWSGEVLSTWTNTITFATANEAGQIAAALQGGILVYLVIEGNLIRKVHEKRLDREISCIDIQPFSAEELDNNKSMSMEVDTVSTTARVTHESSLIAVGLWDDFTVRLLSIGDALNELECINLASSDDVHEVDDVHVPTLSRQNRNNMMARSLSLVTLDFSSTAGSSSSKSGSSRRSVNMLFVGLGDGSLISFAVTNFNGTISVQSKKEVCLGTQRIDLVRLTTEQGGTCILATGDRPTVIYLAGIGGTANQFNPKLCYSNVNVASSEEDDSQRIGRCSSQQNIALNVATPFYSSILFDSGALGKQQYSICVADDASLKLGVIDDIQKLHVLTCRLGMAPRRIVHCPEGHLFAVGCIESGIQNFGLSGDEANMGNCIRFMDDTTFDDLERLDLEPYEMILSMTYASLKVLSSVQDTTDADSNAKTDSVAKPFLLVGTAYALPDEDEPTRGRILVFSCQPDDASAATSNNGRAARQITEFSAEGGVYSICQFYEGKILAAVNSRTHVCQLVDDVGLFRLEYLGLGHFGHILSLFVKSRVQRTESSRKASNPLDPLVADISNSGKRSSAKSSNEPEEMIAIVGDLMRSISLVQYYPQHQTLEEIARDFNTNWTCAVEMLNNNIYLGAENWNNLFCLRRNTSSSNEEILCRLDTIGEYHLGEMCNKFMSGSLVMPVSSSASSMRRQVRRGNSPQKKGAVESPSTKKSMGRLLRPFVATGSQTLFGTVDGTLGVILGLDSQTTAFFSALERAMARVIRHVGDFSHQQYRAVHAERRVHPAHGFIDGDLVESFLDLDRTAMNAIVAEMNRDGGWDHDDAAQLKRDDQDMVDEGEDGAALEEADSVLDLSVEEVLAMVEEMTMLH